MPKFLCIHTVPPKAVSIDQVKQMAQAAQTDKAVHGQWSFGSLAEGKVACVMEAASRDAVVGFFKSKNMPADSIIQMDFQGEHGNVTKL